MKVVLFLLVMLTSAQAQSFIDQSRSAIPDADADGVVRAVGKFLRDPQSAQIKSVRLFRERDGRKTYCGEVNARSIAGGYVGFRPFVWVTGGEAVVFEDPNEGQLVSAVLTAPAVCR